MSTVQEISTRPPSSGVHWPERPRLWNKSAPSAFICLGWTDPGLLASKPPGYQPELQYVSAVYSVSVWPSKQIETHVRNVCCSLPSWCREQTACLSMSPPFPIDSGRLGRQGSDASICNWSDIPINGSDGTNILRSTIQQAHKAQEPRTFSGKFSS